MASERAFPVKAQLQMSTTPEGLNRVADLIVMEVNAVATPQRKNRSSVQLAHGFVKSIVTEEEVAMNVWIEKNVYFVILCVLVIQFLGLVWYDENAISRC